MKAYLTEDSKWVSFYPKFGTGFYVEKAGYFDERPEVHVTLTSLLLFFAFPFLLIKSWLFIFILPLLAVGWGQLYIHLPIRTGIQDSESAAWGINYHGNIFWIYIGGGGNFAGGKKWKTIHMPWEYDWVRTSTLLKGGSWFNETKRNRVDWSGEATEEGSYNWLLDNEWQETYDYTDSYDGTKLQAKVSVKEREWRMRWLKWTRLFSKTKKTIEVNFSEEVGKEKGSWKGGVTGCGYDLRENETPLEALRRMERDRKF